MSNITRIRIDYTDGAPLAPDDPRTAMARSSQVARAVVAAVDADNAGNPTPCAEWNALQLAQHIIAVADRAAAGPSGADLAAMAFFADVPLAELNRALDAALRRVHEAWRDDAALTTMIDAPWGTFPGAQVIGVYAAETLVHTWDLSVAVRVALDWPDADAAIHYEMSKIGIPEAPRDEFMPFDPVVRPGPDAPMIEHLVGWQGRDVDRWRVAG